MADVKPQPTVEDGRVLFVRGTDPKEIRKISCKECFYGVACLGPQESGGDTYADVVAETSDQEILEKASCLRRIES